MLSMTYEEDIKSKIFEIRGQQIMLDKDLAILYECVNGTKTINQAVARNIGRFPEDFYFQLTEEEHSEYYTKNQNQIRKKL